MKLAPKIKSVAFIITNIPFAILATFVVGATMTFHAIIEITNAFFHMFRTNFCRRMLVAAITGVAGQIVIDVASRTGGVVITVKQKQRIMIKSRWFPLLHTVAILAVALYLPMEIVIRFSMAAVALQLCVRCQQFMIESRFLPSVGGMALVAGYSHVLVQIIVGLGMAAIALCTHLCLKQAV